MTDAKLYGGGGQAASISSSQRIRRAMACSRTYCSRKAELLDYAQCCRKSIGDLEMQLDFLMKELRRAIRRCWPC